MKIRHSVIIGATLGLLTILPSCKQKSSARRPVAQSTPLATSIDIPEIPGQDELSFIDAAAPSPSQQEAPALTAAPEREASPKAASNGAKPATSAKNEGKLEEDLEEPSIEFHFENADLETLLNQVSELFDITFVADDSITPMLQGAKSVKGHKISFKTQSPLTKKEAWNLFLTFLDIAGFTVIAEPNPKLKRIVTIETAKKSPLPSYIGVPPSALPDSEEMIRYVYFVENVPLETIRALLQPPQAPNQGLLSKNSSLAILSELKAFVITDNAYNIKSLMNIIKELDKVTMPQAMSVLKLRRADAQEVKRLYDTLAQVDDKSLQQQRFMPTRRSSASYFSENVAVYAEPRTNSLILLGPADGIKRIESFITEVDIDLPQPYSPLNVMQLKYADAETVARIMQEVTKFGATTEAGKVGGVRAGDKFLRPLTFTPEKETNRIIVRGDYEDFLKAKEIMLELDMPQPQVAIEVMLVSASLNHNQQLGSQIRSRFPGTEGLLGTDVKFQTSGLFGTRGIVENPDGNGIDRLLGNLLNLVSQGVAAGNTIVSLGDSLSVYGIIQALEAITNIEVLANPFLIATNKTPAQVSLGEVRRVVTGTIVGTQDVNTYGDAPAELKVEITPQINSDGMIVLNIVVELSNFVGRADPNNAERQVRVIKTKTVIANKEVIALGGLIQNNIQDNVTKLPILGDIPVFGWLFKNKQKLNQKSNLLILISTRIIEPDSPNALLRFTNDHITDYTDTLNEMQIPAERRDPVNRWFFGRASLTERATDEFIFKRHKEALTKAKIPKEVTTPIPVAQAKPSMLKAPDVKLATRSNRSKRSLRNHLSSDKEIRA